VSDRRAIAFAALTCVWLLGLELLGVEAALAYLAPALLILLPLLGGRYLGDEALVRAATRRTRLRPRRSSAARPRRPGGALLPRGGLLVATALAGRAPPAPPGCELGPRRARRRMRLRITMLAAASGILTLAPAGTAAAHITANPPDGPSDGYTTASFQVPHGCEESPTTQVRIQIPPSVPSATPSVHPLWDVTTKEGKKDKVELHGETITRGVSEIIYTTKQPLPPDRLDSFAISLKLPAGKEGDSVYFPTVQKCEQGQTGWIQIPQEGESAEELEEPAPAITLTAAEGGDGGGAADDSASGQGAETEPAANVQAAAVAGDDDEGAPVWLAVVALGVGALGLAAGIAGLMAGRRRTT
jgi:periplasmic copper chaperone A